MSDHREEGMDMGLNSEEKVLKDVEDGNEAVACELSKNVDETEVKEIEISVGREFDTDKEVYVLFKEYARQKGFPVRIRSTAKDSNGVKKWAKFTCSRGDKRESMTVNSKKPRPMIGLGCQVQVSAKKDVSGKWVITSMHLDHNHDCSPSKSHLLQSNGELSKKAKRGLEQKDQVGISVPKSFRVCVEEARNYEITPFVSKDSRNYMRRLRLGEGDASAIQTYFMRMEKQNKDFFFKLQFDEEGRLENVFWADARSRLAYKEFGKVVTFDTTYLVNRYDLPLAPFVGVNHHGQSTLLGCGLVSHETTENFIWLFRTWLECMGDCAPQGIITDQDRAIQNAISEVFPNTVHRWCLWHILKKVPEKLNGYNDYHSVVYYMLAAVYDSLTPSDFELSWNEMIDKYNLHQDPWLSGLYVDRHHWVPVYVKTSFWAGMSTTQRNESMNSFFDAYVNQKTSLKQFVEQYDNALRCKIEKETQEDSRCLFKMIPVTTSWDMEKQVQGIYTIVKFKEFQSEMHQMGLCNIVSKRQDGTMLVYEIKERITCGENNLKKTVHFIVLYNKDEEEIRCNCHLFEHRGTVCRHILVAFLDNDVDVLPDKYILRRWRGDVRRPHSRIMINDNGWVVTVEHARYDEMCTLFYKIANLACMTEEDYTEVMEWATTYHNKLIRQGSRTGSN